MSSSNDIKTNSPLKWDSVSAKQQTLLIKPSSWRYSVFPYMSEDDYMYEGEYGDLIFSFEGEANINSSTKLAITASIKTLEPKEKIGKLHDRWNNVPDDYQGYAHLHSEEYEPPLTNCIGLTLLCRKEAIIPLYRAFMCGFNNVKGTVGVKITLGYPDETGNDFWDEEWRDKWLEIKQWGVDSGSEM